MYRRDLLTAEIKRLAEAVAKIFGLKNEGKTEEAQQKLEDLLEEEFLISYSDLLHAEASTFQIYLAESSFPAEKLDLLSQIIYSEFEQNQSAETNRLIALKLQMIYYTLGDKFKTVSMVNLTREKIIKNYLNQHS